MCNLLNSQAGGSKAASLYTIGRKPIAMADRTFITDH